MVKEHIFKICVVGASRVGKTSIITRYIDDTFHSDTKITIGTNLFITRVKLPDNDADITLQIWDIGGNQKFDNIRPVFYSGARGIIYTYDLTRSDSLIDLLRWKKEIDTYIGSKPSLLVGNKLDLIKEKKQERLSEFNINKIKENLDALNYLETSAKTDKNIDLIFQKMAMFIYNYNRITNNYSSIHQF